MATNKPKSPAMKSVNSSMLHSYGFDPETGELHITFHGKEGPGSTHAYQGVDEKTFAAFDAAESKGKFFGANIRRLTSRKVSG